MTNEITLFKSGVPAYLQSEGLNDITKSLLGAGQQGKVISIRGGVFRLTVDGKEIAVNEERSMKAVIVNVAPKVARTFYPGVYDPNVKAAPACWSADGDRPDKSVTAPQSATCGACERNAKGSGNDGAGRACRFGRKIAVVLENDMGGDIFGISLPSQSIFGKGEDGKLPLNAYAQFLAGFNVNITAVVTEIRFDTASATPKLTFKAIRPLTEKEYAVCTEQGAAEDAKAAVVVSFSAVSDGAKVAAPALAKPKYILGGDAGSEEQEASAVEPKKRAPKAPAPAPEPKKNLAEMLDVWDDEEA